MKTKHILTLAIGLLVGFTACKKDDEAPSIKESEAVIKTNIKVDSPNALARTATWPEIFYNLDTQDTSSKKSGQIVFTGGFNVDLAVSDSTKYTLGVFTDAEKTLQNITYDYLKSAEITYSNKSFGLESATKAGWYGYNMTAHELSVINGKFAVVYQGTSLATAEKVYVIKLNSVGYKVVDATAKTYVGQNNFDVKIYTKK